MFYSYNGSEILVNCATIPNSDVSGIGVRGALYLQAAMMIILSMLKQRPSDILFSNLSSQTTALALICATYFDPKVDVPHTLVASHFSILNLPHFLLRYTTFDTSVQNCLQNLFSIMGVGHRFPYHSGAF